MNDTQLFFRKVYDKKLLAQVIADFDGYVNAQLEADNEMEGADRVLMTFFYKDHDKAVDIVLGYLVEQYDYSTMIALLIQL